jgi:hypothetical protein
MDGPHRVIDKKAPQQVERSNIFLEEMASRVRQLSPAEALSVLNRTSWVVEAEARTKSFFEKEGRIYIIRFDNGIEHPDPQLLRAFVYQLDIAANRMESIIDYNKKFFIIQIEKQEAFSSNEPCVIPGVDGLQSTVFIGKNFIQELSKSFKSENYPVVSTDIQSRFFHELVHEHRKKFFDTTAESITQLGEFLYDPKTNENRNENFKITADFMFIHLKYGGFDSHTIEWVNISKILLWEYKQLNPNFSIPTSLEDQRQLVAALHLFYKDVLQEQRDKILKTYITKSEREIRDIASDYGKKLGLKF